MKRIKPSPALLVAVVALVAALAGGAVAGVAVTALNKKEKKQVTKIAKKQAKKQTNKTVKGWAVVDEDGSLVRGSKGAGSAQLFKPGTNGSYEIDFGTDVSDCSLLAGLGRVDAKNLDPDPGEVGTAYRNGNAGAVYVKTFDSSGADADRSFHLAVFC